MPGSLVLLYSPVTDAGLKELAVFTSLRELDLYCDGVTDAGLKHLAGFKCPDAIEFGELPKTSTGKVQKHVLREREWAGRTVRVN